MVIKVKIHPGRIEKEDAKIQAQVQADGNVRITEFDGEGDSRVETYSYYLVPDIPSALKAHASLSGKEGK